MKPQARRRLSTPPRPGALLLLLFMADLVAGRVLQDTPTKTKADALVQGNKRSPQISIPSIPSIPGQPDQNQFWSTWQASINSLVQSETQRANQAIAGAGRIATNVDVPNVAVASANGANANADATAIAVAGNGQTVVQQATQVAGNNAGGSGSGGSNNAGNTGNSGNTGNTGNTGNSGNSGNSGTNGNSGNNGNNGNNANNGGGSNSPATADSQATANAQGNNAPKETSKNAAPGVSQDSQAVAEPSSSISAASAPSTSLGSGQAAETGTPAHNSNPLPVVAATTALATPDRPSNITFNGTDTEAFIYIPLTYFAPTTCSEGWSWTTSGNYFQDGFSLDAVNLISSSSSSQQPLYVIDPTAVPASRSQQIFTASEPHWSGECTVPDYEILPGSSSTATHAGLCKSIEVHFNGVDGARGSMCEDDLSSGMRAQQIVAIVFCIMAIFLIAGLIESWVKFRALCLGQAASRGLPISFAFIIPFLACFFLLVSSSGFLAKSEEDQIELRALWGVMSYREKLRNWLIWGFRWEYPYFLGKAPPRRHKQRRFRDPAMDAPEVVQRSHLTSPSSQAPILSSRTSSDGFIFTPLSTEATMCWNAPSSRASMMVPLSADATMLGAPSSRASMMVPMVYHELR